MQKYFLIHCFIFSFCLLCGWNNLKAQEEYDVISNSLLDDFLYSPNPPLQNRIDSILTIAKNVYKKGNNVAKLKSLLVIGRANIIKGEYPLAKQALESGLLLLNKIEQQKLHADYYLEAGKLYYLNRQYARSLNYYNLAVSTYESFRLPDEMAMAKLGKVEIYRKLEEYEEADKLLKEIGVQMRLSLSDFVRAEYYNRLAAVYNEKNTGHHTLNFLDSSIHYSLLALQIAEKLQNKHLTAISYNELGFSFEIKEMTDSAFLNYSRAEKIWDDLKYFRYSAQIKNNLGRMLLKQKNYQMSIKKIMEILPLVEKNDWKDNMVYSYFLLADNYEQLNDYRNSMKFFKKFAELNAITLKEEMSKDIQEIKEKYEMKENEYRLVQIEYEKRIQEAKKNYLIIISLTILLAFSIGIMIRQKWKNS